VTRALAIAAALAVAVSVEARPKKAQPVDAPPPSSSPETRPWAEGVTPENQTAALALFKEGNALFAESQHAAALAKYRDALRLWDHPAIRYNAAVALINLDQPLAADAELDSALRFGDAPLGPDTYKQALLYKKLLSGQLADLHVACDEPGAEVTLDGERLFVAPGDKTLRLLPGAHSLVARKAGYLDATHALQLPPGKKTDESIKLVSLASLPTRTVRRWAAWKPWVLFGAGVVVAAVGVPLMLDAKSNYDKFDQTINTQCPSGCAPSALPTTAVEARDRAKAENGAALAMFGVGGAAAVAGVVMLILNTPHAEVRRPMPVALAPVLGPSLAGLTASLRF
jgi:tetratricopeptide (TPR) repeat protein